MFLTWEQLSDWHAVYEQEPWGDLRADMRAAANSVWLRGLEFGGEVPDLIHPYFNETDPAEMAKRAKLLDAKVAEMKADGSQ